MRPTPHVITVETFLADPHAAKYRDVVDRDGETLDRVFAILNDQQVVHDMTSATRLDLPALQGAIEPIATTNPAHLARYVDARHWSDI